MSGARPLPVIVTDLDGTLLDHHSYSCAPAADALALIAERGYPLILNSSKTRAEMLALQEELGLHQPFVCENGAAVYLPRGEDWDCHAFAAPRRDWLDWVHRLRTEYDYPFEGFSDWGVDAIAEHTGLPPAKAALAAQREFTEPLTWQGDDRQREAFASALAGRGLRLVRGGRFYSLQGRFDKAQAMQWLQDYYRQQHAAVLSIALGDSPNDCAMLNAADIAVVIHSAQSDDMVVDGAGRVIRTTLPGPGPAGWQKAITTIIGELDSESPNQKGANHG